MLDRLARGGAAGLHRAKAFVAGILIGVAAWTPVFAVTAEETDWQQYGLPGALAMFGAGVWLGMDAPARRKRATQPRDPAGPSLPGMDRLPA
jgi:peptidoglycan/LPS O-acetylase OafA/YrhL